jgi:hypothetical protein
MPYFTDGPAPAVPKYFRGVIGIPVTIAAKRAQVSGGTMTGWLRTAAEFNGAPLQAIQEIVTGRYFIAEECLLKLEDRFVRAADGTPAGRISLGPQPDKSGYLTTHVAGKALGLTSSAMNSRVHTGRIGTVELEAIRDTMTKKFYVPERVIEAVKRERD